MRYKRIILSGSFMITSVIVLGVLMYYFNQDSCPMGTFLCKNSTNICRPQRDWCNGIQNCPNNDDEDTTNCFDEIHSEWGWFLKKRGGGPEKICDSLKCPSQSCTCKRCIVTCINSTKITEIPRNLSPNITRLTMRNNSLSEIAADAFVNYPEIISLYIEFNKIDKLARGIFSKQSNLRWLLLSHNKINEINSGDLIGLLNVDSFWANDNNMTKFDFSDLKNSTSLERIDFSKNLLTHENIYLPYLPVLKKLSLSENKIKIVDNNLFSRLPALKCLELQKNGLQLIEENAFINLGQLTELRLEDNEIVTLPDNLFQSLINLKKLTIGYNPIENLQTSIFNPLKKIRSLGLQEIDMENSEKNAFNQFNDLDFVYFKRFHYCMTYAPNVKKCRPVSDGVSSLSHLLGKPILRAAVWGISSVTCTGNALVLWGRITSKDENRVLSIVIRNLAVSDMLMGMYLLVIGVVDVQFRDKYTQQANIWISSWSCTLLGMLAMISSEVSVLILSFMSVERFLLIVAPLSGQQRALTPKTAKLSMIIIWITGFILASLPVIHWRSSTKFYGLNGMCFPLHIDDPFIVGWEYSAFIFLGLNLAGLVIIGYVYAAMFASIWRTRHNTPLSIGDSEFALRFFLIVLTDASCWAPIIALKIMAFLKYPIAPDLHAWVVVFILPVNSAINPLLYTFTTPKFRERLLNEKWISQIYYYFSRRGSSQDSQESSSDERRKNFMLTVPVSGIKNWSIKDKLSNIP